jgi:hypothetical protein
MFRILLFFVFILQIKQSLCQQKILCQAQYKYQIYHPGKQATYYEGSRIGRQMITPAVDPYYETAYSTRYNLYISFYSGEYLNELTNSYKYNDNNIISIIEWKNGGASVIKVDNYTTNVKEITNLTKGITLTGYDQEQRYWEITIPKE